MTLPGGQSSFVYDLTSPFKALVGGMGSGKTDGAAKAALLLGSINAPLPGVFVEPTFSIVKDAALPAFEGILSEQDLPYEWLASDHILKVGRGRSAFPIYFRSGDRPHRLVGFNAAWGIIDEPGQQKAEIFKRVVQRCRNPMAKIRQIGLAGTPEGLNWFYRVCEAAPPRGMALYRARTADNLFLPLDYLENMMATLSPQELLAYAEGRFVNLTSGSVYPSFSRQLHGRACMNPLDGDVVVGCDFNIAKMAWPIARRIGGELHVFDELVGFNRNTIFMADALNDRLKEWHRIAGRAGETYDQFRDTVRVHTDATGGRGQTSAVASDLEILRAAGFNVIAASTNPAVRDRVYSVEQRMRAHVGTAPLFYVDVDRCVELVRSLEGQVWGNDGAPEKKNGKEDLSGPNDGLGYMIWGFFDWRATVPRGNRIVEQQYG